MKSRRRVLDRWGVANTRGFTLAELLVVTALVGLVMAGVVSLLMSSNQSYRRGTNQVEAQQSARVAMARMAQEIREAGYNPSSATTLNPLSGFTATGLTIQNDWNANGAIDPTLPMTDPVKGTSRGERVTYTLSGSDLTRQESAVDAAPLVVISGVQSLAFEYLDSNDTVTVTAANVRTVVITATVSQFTGPAAALNPANVVLTNRIRLRNK
jgi:prepilin-type N-terminal cleavage/methylation domain-containing protein